MQKAWLLLLGLFSISFVQPAFAQIPIILNQTTACWENYTAYAEMWRNCGVTEDWLQTLILPWQYATGGYFSMFIAAILILFTYIKYHKVVYPLMIGSIMMPLSFALFPTPFMNFGFLVGSISIGFLIIHIILRQTKEYSG